MNKDDILQVERPWGNFRQFTHNQSSTVKILTINPNESLSLQSHNKRSEFWHVISGNGIIQINDESIEVKTGDELRIEIGDKHRMSSGDKGLEILEISLGDFDEDDIIRYEDKYGRI